MSVLARGRGDRFTQDVFRSLGEREGALVESLSGRAAALSPNRLLVSEGEVGNGLFRIARGWAYRYRTSGNGSRQILDFLLPGEIVGLQSALLGVLDYSVRALTPLRVSAGPSSARARPKSITTARPSGCTSTFAGLTSRCSTPAACAQPSASAACRTRSIIARSESPA